MGRAGTQGRGEDVSDNINEKKTGIYKKFEVRRTDGSSGPGGKHEGCSYFVLDMDHDEFAIPALRAYAHACEKEFPALSKDLMDIVNASPCNCREAGCPHLFPHGPVSAMRWKLMRSKR